MKKNLLYLASLLLAVTVMASCSPDDGTDPGSDGAPVATVYTYSNPGDGYSADNDVRFRVVTNNKASKVRYLAELTSEKEARNMTDEQYADYVEQNGTELEVGTNNFKDVYLTGLKGLYTISFIPEGGNTGELRTFTFAGLDFKPWATGTYSFGAFGGSKDVSVLHSEIGDRYRIENLWADGYNLDFTISGSTVSMLPAEGFEIGRSHSKYGPYIYVDGGSTFDESSNTVTFNYALNVSAGTFGDFSDVLVLKKN